MTVEVYGVILSPPTRTVLTALDMHKIPYNLKPTFPYMGEQAFEGMKMVIPDAGHSRMPEFLKMNPQHNIPVYKEGDFVMNESRAIISYLANKEENTKLYPKDAKIRARINQRLFFELGSLFKAFAAIAETVFFKEQKPSQAQLDSLNENLQWLNDFIKPTGYAAGTEHVTLADIAFLSSYSSIAECGMVDVSKFPELTPWLERIKKEVPNYAKVNGEGAAMYGMQYKNKMKELGF